ncbi:hypothetical protein CYMTET_54237 [Cymbomonas tetramitiformis]|uniref:Uncharacterized protein n=1 Tax=Cymbomonas tetramitiformis TaxID=36881 RepID=A0AAE0BH32_9CHLO|nr:hypothetical protein CYMTET_54237 [Cymbomonas tetramitiformis]
MVADVLHDHHTEADRLAQAYVRIGVDTLHTLHTLNTRHHHVTGTLGQPVIALMGGVPTSGPSKPGPCAREVQEVPARAHYVYDDALLRGAA